MWLIRSIFRTSPINSNSASSGQFSNDFACAHNNREGVSIMDVVEHSLKGEIGSAARDIADVRSGYESFAGVNQEPARNDSPKE